MPVDALVLAIGDLATPVISLQAVSVALQTNGNGLQIHIAKLRLFEHTYSDLRLTCPRFDWQSDLIACNDGRIKAASFASAVNFRYSLEHRHLELMLAPSSTERWRLIATFADQHWQARLEIVAGQAGRFVAVLPAGLPSLSQGTLTGTLAVQGGGSELRRIDADLRWAGLSFADPSGLHAGDKLAGSLKLRVSGGRRLLHWNTDLAWDQGEVFWSPLYFPNGGHQLQASGDLEGERLRIDAGQLRLAGLGTMGFSGEWSLRQGLQQGMASAMGFDAKGLYGLLLRPFLDKTSFAELNTSGSVDIQARYADATLQKLELALHDVSVDDQRKRFTLEHVNARLPWSRQEKGRGSLQFAAGSVAGIPIGPLQSVIELRGLDFAVDDLELPVLDGKLAVRDLRVWREGDDWRSKFHGVLLPVSMEALTRSLGGPVMRGVLAATIPDVTYANDRIDVGGALAIRVFDGDIVIDRVSLSDPLGRAPRLEADVRMRNLDLGLVTSTFKFGSMEGRIDADVMNLELSNWKPVKFDARVESSPGRYRKKISQQAVQNISSLGGAGAAAAIQRSFLGFFQEFGYDRLGLSCRLRNNVCEMAGVESTPQGYMIVKGGGIPAITVLGYNRFVGWDELIERLSRITQSNAQPVIK